MRTMTTLLIVLTFGVAGFAQDGGPAEEFDLEAAMRRIHALMRKAEEGLLETAKRQNASESGQEAVREIEKLLRGNQETGKKIVDDINELLDNLPRQQGGGGGGQQMPKPGEQEPKNQDESQVGDRDPKNSADGEPKDGQKGDPKPEQEQAGTPPPKDPKDEAKPDPSKEWLAQLPPQVRMDVLNGNFERIPEKYRPLIEAWTRKMAEIDEDD